MPWAGEQEIQFSVHFDTTKGTLIISNVNHQTSHTRVSRDQL